MQKKRAIASARSFLNDPKFEFLVDIVDLEPRNGWTSWYDFEENYMKILKNKSIHVYPSKNKSNKTNDVFRKSNANIISKHSYWVMAMFCKSKSLLNFLGNDGRLRVCYFEDNIWKYNISPLLLGFRTLKVIVSGYIEEEARMINSIKIRYIKDLEIEEVWCSGYPSNNKKLQEKIGCHLTSQSLVE